jgi:lactate permease
MIAPLLMAQGISPVLAVATAAVGHTWAGTTGGMALSLRVLAGVTNYTQEALFPDTAILLGISIVLSGFAVAFLLGQKKQWWRVLITGLVAALSHYLLGVLGMIPISALIAAALGFTVGSLLSKKPRTDSPPHAPNPVLRAGLIAYGILVVIMLLVSLIPWLNRTLSAPTWTLQFPQVVSDRGIVTLAESGYVFHFLTHPGTMILLTLALVIPLFWFSTALPRLDLKQVLKATTQSALPGSLGMLFMIGLSTVMEHTGMTLALANGLNALVGGIYPLFSPLVGVVGSFATGSNLNSNVLFGLLQKEVAKLVNASPVVILAAQTTGGSLGSSIAPAKLAVGTSTSSAKGQEGAVLRITLPICLGIALIIGVVTWILS